MRAANLQPAIQEHIELTPIPGSRRSTPSFRVPTPQEALQRREEATEALARALPPDQSRLNDLRRISVRMARHYVRELLTQGESRKTPLGCIQMYGKPRSNGYYHLPLAKMLSDTPEFWGEPIGRDPYLHQVLIIAKDGHYDNIQHTVHRQGISKATHHISHLCHDSSCMTLSHIIIERIADNLSRKRCCGSTIIRVPVVGGWTFNVHAERILMQSMIYDPEKQASVYNYTIWNPCPHRSMEMAATCILPTLDVKPVYDEQRTYLNTGYSLHKPAAIDWTTRPLDIPAIDWKRQFRYAYPAPPRDGLPRLT
jgi:Zinc-binding loop region of homing endonuclease